MTAESDGLACAKAIEYAPEPPPTSRRRVMPAAPTARTTRGALCAAPLCIAAMNATVQSAPRSAISSRATGRPARTASVRPDHVRHSDDWCSRESTESSFPPRARNRAATGAGE